MKFDPKKPHGVITNHSWARYEQNGILYDSQGQPMDQIDIVESEEVLKPANSGERDFAYEQAEAFLQRILEGGPVSRSDIFKECQNNNQNWDKIKSAFADMGEVMQRRNVIFWKLKTE